MYQRVERGTLDVARLHINRLRMEDRAYAHVYGNPVFHPIRLALVSVVREVTLGAGPAHPDTGRCVVDQNVAIAEAAKAKHGATATTARQTAKNYVDNAILDLDMFSRITPAIINRNWPKSNWPDLSLNRTKSYLFFTEKQFSKLTRFTDILQVIDQVVREQAESSPDKVQSHVHLPPGIYYDILLQHD